MDSLGDGLTYNKKQQTTATNLSILQPFFWFDYVLKGCPDYFMLMTLRRDWKCRNVLLQHYENAFFLSQSSIYATKQNKNTNTLSSSQMNWLSGKYFFPLILGTWSSPERLLNENGFLYGGLGDFSLSLSSLVYHLCLSLSSWPCPIRCGGQPC